MPMVMIKSIAIFFHLLQQNYHPILINVLKDVFSILEEKDIDSIITSAYRPDDVGVHGTNPCRGIDLRSRHIKMGVAKQICNLINSAWKYDPHRPEMKVAILHDTGRGIHIHIQVHPRTVVVTT